MQTLATTRRHGMLAVMAAASIAIGVSACRTDTQPDQSAVASTLAAAEQVRIGGILWFVDYDAALAVARQQDKSLWVHFAENPG